MSGFRRLQERTIFEGVVFTLVADGTLRDAKTIIGLLSAREQLGVS